eukprot:Nk52_evm64s1992 gene=Nk52_evmTU64s1992
MSGQFSSSEEEYGKWVEKKPTRIQNETEVRDSGRKRRARSDSTSDNSDSDSNSCSRTKKRKYRDRNHKSKEKKKKKKDSKKSGREKHKRAKKKLSESAEKESLRNERQRKLHSQSGLGGCSSKDNLKSDPLPIRNPASLPTGAPKRTMVPQTYEEYLKKQSVVRQVYDEQSGRVRLVKGDGEIIESIVTKSQHKEINRQATQGDGKSFQTSLFKHVGKR